MFTVLAEARLVNSREKVRAAMGAAVFFIIFMVGFSDGSQEKNATSGIWLRRVPCVYNRHDFNKIEHGADNCWIARVSTDLLQLAMAGMRPTGTLQPELRNLYRSRPRCIELSRWGSSQSCWYYFVATPIEGQ
jgi:hypothetical protein